MVDQPPPPYHLVKDEHSVPWRLVVYSVFFTLRCYFLRGNSCCPHVRLPISVSLSFFCSRAFYMMLERQGHGIHGTSIGFPQQRWLNVRSTCCSTLIRPYVQALIGLSLHRFIICAISSLDLFHYSIFVPLQFMSFLLIHRVPFVLQPPHSLSSPISGMAGLSSGIYYWMEYAQERSTTGLGGMKTLINGRLFIHRDLKLALFMCLFIHACHPCQIFWLSFSLFLLGVIW